MKFGSCFFPQGCWQSNSLAGCKICLYNTKFVCIVTVPSSFWCDQTLYFGIKSFFSPLCTDGVWTGILASLFFFHQYKANCNSSHYNRGVKFKMDFLHSHSRNLSQLHFFFMCVSPLSAVVVWVWGSRNAFRAAGQKEISLYRGKLFPLLGSYYLSLIAHCYCLIS